jgi:hypothetical protein
MAGMRLGFSLAGALALLLLGLAAPKEAMAWGKVGHRAVSTVVENHLTRAAASAIRDLLEPGETLADASLWADEHKKEIAGSAAWHYVNVPITEAQYDARFCPSSGCVVSKITEERQILLNPGSSRAEKQQALRLLLHFVEDLHQPLHVGDRNDRGGNDLQVRFFDKGTNLHRLWDDGIIEHHSTDEVKWIGEIESFATAEQIRQWSIGGVETWANESLSAARQAYCVPGTHSMLKPGAVLGQEYFDASLPFVRRRLAQAATRLTTMLNEIFTPPAEHPQ